MSVIPSEINTMRPLLKQAQGRVLVCGLGLGYFAYHLSRKDNVEQIIVVEKEAAVIQWFTQWILPQWEQPEKLKIIHDDAFAAVDRLKPGEVDTIFVDLWHNAADGAPLDPGNADAGAAAARHPVSLLAGNLGRLGIALESGDEGVRGSMKKRGIWTGRLINQGAPRR